MNSNTPNFDDLVADRMILEHLYQRLDTVVPDGARLFKLRAENYTEREICRELGVSTQSTLNYRIKKIDRLLVWDSSCASVDTKDRLISLSLLSV